MRYHLTQADEIRCDDCYARFGQEHTFPCFAKMVLEIDGEVDTLLEPWMMGG